MWEEDNPQLQALAELAQQHRNQEAEKALADLDRAVERLSLTDRHIPLTRTVVGTPRDALRDHLQSGVGTLTMLCLLMVGSALSLGQHSVRWPQGQGPKFANDGGLSLYVIGPVLLGLGVGTLWTMSRTRIGGDPVRYALIHHLTRAVNTCAEALELAGTARDRALRRLDKQCRKAERRLLRAHRARGTLGFISPRRGPAALHAAQAAGALRHDLVRIDVTLDEALPSLGGKLLTICESYIEGRLGALLPEDQLRDAVPVSLLRRRIKEVVQLLFTITAGFGGAMSANHAASAIGLPKDYAPFVAAAGAILGVTLVWGWRQVTILLELWPFKG
ncbi:hypothetical protein [Streptomyces avermitilis]|uniref:hypothetical protein n=1 Tax=Streptomyces avermitilis TaxID=33903 RepID=UPI0033EA3776